MHTHPVLLRRSAATLAAGFACLFGAASIQAQTTPPAPTTVITSLPFTISTSGTYVLNSSLNSNLTTGALITVNASNVTIDFQGNYIAGPVGNPNTSTIGVFSVEQSNVIVRNGTVAFCNEGVLITANAGATNTNSVNPLVDNMRVTNCSFFGIAVLASPASRINNCQVSQTGGSTVNNATYGIYSDSPGGTVQSNVVNGVTNNGTATNAFGIVSGATGFVRQNAVSNVSNGITGGKYQGNLTAATATPTSGGTDAGDNS